MKSLEIKAKTVEEAIQRALEQLGVSREEVEVTVIKEGKAGILGLGADEAVVQVTPLTAAPNNDAAEATGNNDVTEVTREVLEEMLALMGVAGSVVLQDPPPVEEGQEDGAPSTFDIRGEDLGILIGRWGQTLACLQYLVRLMVGHKTKTWAPLVIDVEGYKQRRYRSLQVLARNIAEQVNVQREPFTLEPMPAYERRIIHLALTDHPDITTESVGQGEYRKVVVLPREK